MNTVGSDNNGHKIYVKSILSKGTIKILQMKLIKPFSPIQWPIKIWCRLVPSVTINWRYFRWSNRYSRNNYDRPGSGIVFYYKEKACRMWRSKVTLNIEYCASETWRNYLPDGDAFVCAVGRFNDFVKPYKNYSNFLLDLRWRWSEAIWPFEIGDTFDC